MSSTEFSELLKVPELIEHYGEHRKDDNTISFIQFLAIHYLDVQQQSADDERDSTLPFKSHTHCQSLVQHNNIVPSDIPSLKPAITFVAQSFSSHEEFAYSSYHTNIWQPPKFI